MTFSYQLWCFSQLTDRKYPLCFCTRWRACSSLLVYSLYVGLPVYCVFHVDAQLFVLLHHIGILSQDRHGPCSHPWSPSFCLIHIQKQTIPQNHPLVLSTHHLVHHLYNLTTAESSEDFCWQHDLEKYWKSKANKVKRNGNSTTLCGGPILHITKSDRAMPF